MSLCFFKYRNFRIKIALSLIFRKKIQIYNIKKFQKIPKLKNFEIDLLCFVDKFTFGTNIKIEETGNLIDFFPGILTEQRIVYKTISNRSLSYYLEFILYVMLFSHKYNEMKLTGIRSTSVDVSLENVLYVTLPLLRKLGLVNTRFKIHTHLFSVYNTELVFFFSDFQNKSYISITSQGTVSKIRVITAYSVIYNSIRKETECFFTKNLFFSNFNLKMINLKVPNKNIKFQTITTIIETTEGCIFGEDMTFFNTKKNINWSKILSKIFRLLFEDIATGSCIDKKNHTILFFKILNKSNNDLSVCVGKLTFSDIKFFRDLKKITGFVFSIKYNRLTKNFLIKLIAD